MCLLFSPVLHFFVVPPFGFYWFLTSVLFEANCLHQGEVVDATYVLWRSYPALLAALAESPALGAGA